MPVAKKPLQRVRLDLNSPAFLEVFLRLEGAELAQVARSLDQIRKLDWPNVYASKGLRWEAISHLTAPDGKSTVYSVRLSQKIRGLAFREGELMRFIESPGRKPRPSGRGGSPSALCLDVAFDGLQRGSSARDRAIAGRPEMSAPKFVPDFWKTGSA